MLRNCVFRVLKAVPKNSILRYADNMKTTRQIHCGICLRNPRHTSKANNDTSPALSNKYEVITEMNSPIIENTADEIHSEDKYPILSDEFDGINLKPRSMDLGLPKVNSCVTAKMVLCHYIRSKIVSRTAKLLNLCGKAGVFEIEDLVELLQRENSKDIFVVSVPESIRYVDYICIVTARSKRHIHALSEFVRKVYKKKCNKNDPIPKIEGKDSEEWMALDLGNIALHVFSEKVRLVYDLETLWSVGPEFDDKINKNSEVVDVFENYSAYLKDLKPLG